MISDTTDKRMEDDGQPDIESVLETHGEALESYLKNIYSKEVSPPQKPDKAELSFWRIAGLQSSLFALSAVSGMVLSAIRTGGVFFLIEDSLVKEFQMGVLGTWLSFISMIAALGTFELFVLAYGLVKGMKSGKLEVSGLGVGIAMTTIIFASIFSSFSIVDVGDTASLWFDIIMALVSALGSSLVVFFSSENLGFVVNSVTSVRNEKMKTHGDAYSQWRKDGAESYYSSIYNIQKAKSKKVYNPVPNTPSTKNPQMPEQKQSESNVDWRTLSHEQKKEIINVLSVDEIMKKYHKARSTAFAWKNKTLS